MYRITTLEVCPSNDMFISGGLDFSVRLWDMRTNACHGIIATRNSRPTVSFDPGNIIHQKQISDEQATLFKNKTSTDDCMS